MRGVQEVTVKEAAELLNVSEKTVYRWIRQGVVPTIRVQGQYRFDRTELEGWARHNRIGSFPTPAVDQEPEEEAALLRAVQLGGIHYRMEGRTPEEIYAQVAEVFPFSPRLAPTFRESLRTTLLEREALVSTGIGHGIALPHPRHPRDWGLGHPAVGIFFLNEPVDLKALDGEPVFVLFVILCATVKGHLKMLSRVSHLVSAPETRDFLRGVPNRTDLLERIRHAFPQ
jgi:PTS system nitrogen regulatory IIA component